MSASTTASSSLVIERKKLMWIDPAMECSWLAAAAEKSALSPGVSPLDCFCPAAAASASRGGVPRCPGCLE